MLSFFFRLVPALGLFFISYSVGMLYDVKEASAFLYELVIINILSIFVCGGANVAILKLAADEHLRDYFLYVLVNILISLPLVYIAIFLLDVTLFVYCYMFQVLSLYFSAALKSQQRFLVGSFFEYGLAGLLVSGLVVLLELNINSVKVFYAFVLALLVLVQSSFLVKGIVGSNRGFNYKKCLEGGYTFALVGLYGMINVWAVVFYISANPELFIEYNLTTRLVLFLGFIVSTIDGISMVKMGAWIRAGDVRSIDDYMRMFREKVFPFVLIVFMAGLAILSILFWNGYSRILGFNLILVPMLVLPYVSYFYFGPSGSYLIALGGERVNHFFNLSVSVFQIVFIAVVIMFFEYNEMLVYFMVFSFQMCSVIKFWVYERWIKKIEGLRC